MAPQTHRIPLAGGEFIVLDWTPPVVSQCYATVFVHGLGSHRRGEKALHFRERFGGLGWGFLSVDLRGHGESSGDMKGLTLSRCLADLSAALAWLPPDILPRLTIGSSMGGAVVAWHRALHPDPRAHCAFIAPSFAFPHPWAEVLTPAELAAWERTGSHNFHSEWIDLEIGWGIMEDARRYHPAALAARFASPALILHGMQDAAVDWAASVAFLEQCASPNLELLLIKNGDHRLTEQKVYLFDAMRAWLVSRGILANPTGA